MVNNKKFQGYFALILLLTIIATSLTFFLARDLIYLVVILSLVFISIFILYTRNRLKDIRHLSEYLRQISSGNYSLDVRDNEEGELSILKNEIFKVTSMLSEHRTQLEEDKKQLTMAISDISHQIKTPLTSMMVMTDLLRDSNLPKERRKEFTSNIQLQLERLDWLVSALLTISKIDAGTLEFKEEQVPVKELIEHSLQAFQIPIDIHNLTVQIDVQDSIYYAGDFHWSLEALTNIIKNCIEHTGDGGQLRITAAKNPLYTEISISDTGPGIAKEDIPHIFKRFYKGKQASPDSVGIGLAMAHQIVTNQGGDIEIDSRPGEGTSFKVKFYKKGK